MLKRDRRHLVLLGAAILALGAWGLQPFLRLQPSTFFLGAPIMAISAVIIIFWVKEWMVLPGMWLRPLLGLGTISYAAYLWNLPLSSMVLGRDLSGAAAGFLAASLTVMAAVLSWFLVERPIRAWRDRSENRARGARTLVAGAAVEPTR